MVESKIPVRLTDRSRMDGHLVQFGDASGTVAMVYNTPGQVIDLGAWDSDATDVMGLFYPRDEANPSEPMVLVSFGSETMERFVAVTTGVATELPSILMSDGRYKFPEGEPDALRAVPVSEEVEPIVIGQKWGGFLPIGSPVKSVAIRQRLILGETVNTQLMDPFAFAEIIAIRAKNTFERRGDLGRTGTVRRLGGLVRDL